MVARGRLVFEVLNNGAVIIIGSKFVPSEKIRYSTDGGENFYDLVISDSPVEIYAITVKESSHMRKFLISARAPKFYKKKAMVITVDFSNLHERECVHDKGNPEESDYEEWQPHTTSENGCLDGRKVIYVRKKCERPCFNNDTFT